MMVKTIRRVLFGGAAAVMFWQAGLAIRNAGFTMESLFPAGLGVVMALMAISGKGG